MKAKHWAFLGLAVVGVLYFWHTYSQHGGVSGFKQGLGLS